ncbi:MAG: PEP-CTERM sorting domain-containing protein [Phycisphaeraceae bacterium]|nr:PEP-CTERM sorting domain-containing protein [Phycisphaeraceae bacterium]
MYQKFTWHILSACALGVVLSGSMAFANVNDNLLGHWSLNETNAGSTTVLNTAPAAPVDGERTTTTAINQTAPVGTGYFFDGQNTDPGRLDNVFVGNYISDSLISTDKLTMSIWANPTYLRSPGSTVAASRHMMIGANSQLQLAIRGNQNLYFNYVVNTGTEETPVLTNTNVVGASLNLNEWAHVAVTRDGTAVKIYVNGKLTNDITSLAGNHYLAAFDHDFDDPDPINNPNPLATPNIRALWLGTTSISSGLTLRDFDGYLDDAGIWSGRALSAQEVAVMHGLAKHVGVGLNVYSLDNVLARYNAASGSTGAGGYQWSYATGLPSSTVGETGGSAAGLDAWIVLDAAGNGVQITGTLHDGDANGDGMVNLADLQILGDNWQSSGAIWDLADFSGDGTVNLSDLQILGDNWGFGVGPDISFDEALAIVGVPEPTSLILLAAGASLVVSRRRK